MKNSHDSVTQGCCDFVGAIIYDACNPPPPTIKSKYGFGYKDNIKQRERVKEINRDWALNSKLLKLYCDVMNFDWDRVFRAILEKNL